MKRPVFFYIALTISFLFGLESLLGGAAALREANALRATTNITAEEYNKLAIPGLIYLLASIAVLALSTICLIRALKSIKRTGDFDKACNIMLFISCAIIILLIGITETVSLFNNFETINTQRDFYKGSDQYQAASYLASNQKYALTLVYLGSIAEMEALLVFAILSCFKFKKKEVRQPVIEEHIEA